MPRDHVWYLREPYRSVSAIEGKVNASRFTDFQGPIILSLGLGGRMEGRRLIEYVARMRRALYGSRDHHIIIIQNLEGEGGGNKGIFVVHLTDKSTHWENGTLRIETLPEFGYNIRRGYQFLSMDVVMGFHHFRLAPSMCK